MSEEQAPKKTKAPADAIDLATLSPEALANLQKQLSDRNKAVSAHRDERNTIMVAMLQEKDKEGEFVHTTRDVARKMATEGLCAILTGENFDSEDLKKEVEKEIRKVQAKKQQLEKATDEAGKLIHPEGTFGYKSSGGIGSGLVGKAVKPATIASFFESGRAAELSKEQIKLIAKALKG